MQVTPLTSELEAESSRGMYPFPTNSLKLELLSNDEDILLQTILINIGCNPKHAGKVYLRRQLGDESTICIRMHEMLEISTGQMQSLELLK